MGIRQGLAGGIALVMDGASLAVCLKEMPERFVQETNKCGQGGAACP